MAFLGGVFGGTNTANNANATTYGMGTNAINAVNQGATTATNDINSATSAALGDYSTNYYSPYTATGNAANTMYSNALGLNGAAGNAAATSAFQTNPGYQFALGQGEQAINRNAQSTGFGASGNQAEALSNYAQGQGQQAYSSWLSNLQGVSNQGLTAAAGQTGIENSQAGINANSGNSLANVATNQGNQSANIYTGIGNSVNSNNATQAASDAQGGANLLGTVLGGANLAAKAFQLSDENSKTDITPVGNTTTDDGLDIPLFAYRYKGDPKSYPKVVGPMAQDIEKVAPSAVKKIDGKRIVSSNWLKKLAA